MSVADTLDRLRTAAPECSMAVFCDLDSQLVLRTSAAAATHQETLDELCRQATRCFAAADHVDTGQQGRAGRADEAIVLTGGDTRVFLRARGGGGDAICCVGGPASDPFQMVECARAALGELAECS